MEVVFLKVVKHLGKNKKLRTIQNNLQKKQEQVLYFQIWLGRRDSNPRMSEPKSDALPLGDAPIKKRRDCNSLKSKIKF